MTFTRSFPTIGSFLASPSLTASIQGNDSLVESISNLQPGNDLVQLKWDMANTRPNWIHLLLNSRVDWLSTFIPTPSEEQSLKSLFNSLRDSLGLPDISSP